MSELDPTVALRRELHRILTDLDQLPADAFTERAPLRARADELRTAIRATTLDDRVERDATRLEELRTRAKAVQAEVDRIAGSGVHGGTAAAGMEAGGGGAAEMARMNQQGKEAQGMPRLQADLAVLLDRIAAAERFLQQRS